MFIIIMCPVEDLTNYHEHQRPFVILHIMNIRHFAMTNSKPCANWAIVQPHSHHAENAHNFCIHNNKTNTRLMASFPAQPG